MGAFFAFSIVVTRRYYDGYVLGAWRHGLACFCVEGFRYASRFAYFREVSVSFPHDYWRMSRSFFFVRVSLRSPIGFAQSTTFTPRYPCRFAVFYMLGWFVSP